MVERKKVGALDAVGGLLFELKKFHLLQQIKFMKSTILMQIFKAHLLILYVRIESSLILHLPNWSLKYQSACQILVVDSSLYFSIKEILLWI